MPKHIDLPIEERLFGHRKIDPETGCWRTVGFIAPNGYGRITIHSKTYNIHRVSASVFLRLDLKDELTQVNHKKSCPYKDCFNPEHLYIGNQAENVRDSVRQKTHKEARKTHCPRGHEYTLENTLLRYFKRYCRACIKIYNSQNYKNQKRKERENLCQMWHLAKKTFWQWASFQQGGTQWLWLPARKVLVERTQVAQPGPVSSRSSMASIREHWSQPGSATRWSRTLVDTFAASFRTS